MRDLSFSLRAGLFAPVPPFTYAHAARPGCWTVRDGLGAPVASARTRAGARLAVVALWSAAGQRVAA